jgi:hypothetical protein
MELLLKRFGRNGFCPHGVPLEGGLKNLRQRHGAIRLSEAQPGENCELLRVYEKDHRFLKFLDENHLRPGAKLRIATRQYDDTMMLVVAVAGKKPRQLHLGKSAAERIWVKRVRE